MHRELPSLCRTRVEEIIRREMQPLEASLLRNLDLVGLIRECQDRLSRAYRAASVREEWPDGSPSGNTGSPPDTGNLQTTAKRLDTGVQQPPKSSPDFLEAVLQAPPSYDQDNSRLDYSALDEEIFDSQKRKQKQTSGNTSGSDSGYASGRLCDCSGSCSCLGWTIVSGTEDADARDSLAAGLARNHTGTMQEESIQWQSWMENEDWVVNP